jgi:HEAT repeat protein
LANETSPRVREAIFTALIRIATPASVAVILPFLRADDSRARMEAMDALAALEDASWPAIVALLRDTAAPVRILACDLIRGFPADRAAPLLCNLLEAERDANVCAAAVDALAEIGGRDALPALERCAARFKETPFLVFAITIATDRIESQPAAPRD